VSRCSWRAVPRSHGRHVLGVGLARPVLARSVGVYHCFVPIFVPEVGGRGDVDASERVEHVPPSLRRCILVLVVAGGLLYLPTALANPIIERFVERRVIVAPKLADLGAADVLYEPVLHSFDESGAVVAR